MTDRLDPATLPASPRTAPAWSDAVVLVELGDEPTLVPITLDLVAEDSASSVTNLVVTPHVPLRARTLHGLAVTGVLRDAAGRCVAPSSTMRGRLDGSDSLFDHLRQDTDRLLDALTSHGAIATTPTIPRSPCNWLRASCRACTRSSGWMSRSGSTASSIRSPSATTGASRSSSATPSPQFLIQMVEDDLIVPNTSNTLYARSVGVPHLGEVLFPIDLVELEPELPTSANLAAAVTGGSFQYDVVYEGDGPETQRADHGGLSRNPVALEQTVHFLRTFEQTGTAEILDPYETLGIE